MTEENFILDEKFEWVRVAACCGKTMTAYKCHVCGTDHTEKIESGEWAFHIIPFKESK